MELSRQFLKIAAPAFKRSAPVLMLLTLGGCGYLVGEDGLFPDRQGDYLESPVAPPLQVPAELDSFTLAESFPVPAAESISGGVFVTPPPPRELDTRVREGVIIQRFGDRRWILIGATPGQVWPRLRDFWATAQVPIGAENPVAGTMETEWLETERGDREKYVSRIEPGLHAGNSEVYVVQVSESELLGANPQDVEVSHEPERAGQMLEGISVYMAERTDLYRASSVSLLAGSIESDSKANIIRGDSGEFILTLRIDFARAWGQVGQSLTSAGATIVDSNQDEARLLVEFTPAGDEEERGFFGRLFRGGSDEQPEVGPFTVRLVEQGEDMYHVVAELDSGSVPAAVAQQRQDELIQAISDNLN